MKIILSILLPLFLLPACSDPPESANEVFSEGAAVPTASSLSSLQLPVSAQQRIKTAPVTERLLSQAIVAPGGVALDLARMAKVSSRIEGQVEEVFVELGNDVKAGDPLVAIGSLKLDELVQEFLVSKVQVDLRQANFERTQKLYDEQIVSERRLMEDRAQYLEAKAINQHVTEKLQNMGLLKKELNALLHSHTMEGHRYIIKSPLTGTISEQTVVLGQGIKTSDQLFEVVDTRQVWVFANLPIEQAQRFKEGDRGTIIAKGRKPIEAPLAYIAPVADKATLTIQFRFDVDNHQGLLKPNEYVEVRLEESASSILAIPVTAPTFIEGVRGVFVKQGNDYTFTPVKLGQESDGWIEVTKGLTAGDEVVIEGVFDLKNSLLKDSIEGEG
ncbi:MAG: efflux RND transporter periplasmic adaptor subunit [Nitrospirae bacterium]|nr:efflux RND transporter periplasmic adaptor subunit [Nitrospirota bacterium]